MKTNKICIIWLWAIFILGCDTDGWSELKQDNGLTCFDEVVNSTYDLNNLPPDIESQIVDYLSLEHQEQFDPKMLSYIGEFTVCGKPVKFWGYECSSECYVTIQGWRDGFFKSMSYQQPN
ncbi:TPA: hypothetical protein ACN34I_004581 [Vibrio parahaemolyticus]